MSFQVRTLKDKPRRRWPWKSFLVTVLKIGGPLLAFYEQWRTREEEKQRKQKRTTVLKRVLMILLAILCSLLLMVGVARALIALKVITFSSFTTATGVPPPADENGFTNILLVGQGDKDHDGQDLTDTIIVASLDPGKTKSVALLSLPRDLYFLSTEKMGKGKLNSLYRDYKILLKRKGLQESDAAFESTRQLGVEVGKALGITIHGVVKVNFTAFRQAVDAIGGVDVLVPSDIVDTEYPDENYGFQTFEIKQGLQHLDGETALKYARSRHTSSDFDRSARQQQILKAMAEKARAEGLEKDPRAITRLFGIFQQNVVTTFTLRELIGLAGIAKEIGTDRAIAVQLNDRNALYDVFVEPGGLLYTPPRTQFDGAAVLLPVSVPEFPVTWKQVRAFTQLFFQQRSLYLAHPTIAVLNAGGKSGLARRLATELSRYGFTVEHIANASLKDEPSSFVTSTDTDGDLALFFATLFAMNDRKDAFATLTNEEVRQITIVLGKDFSYRPLQDFILPKE
ncbi:MAG: LCP family protein [Candidatus Peribacteraceae bacterium]|nr:LCP family protein [Candidatus Peribacteraceae bacterium]